MNLPNKLSMLRACMIPIFVIFALMDAASGRSIAATGGVRAGVA